MAIRLLNQAVVELFRLLRKPAHSTAVLSFQRRTDTNQSQPSGLGILFGLVMNIRANTATSLSPIGITISIKKLCMLLLLISRQ